MDNRNEVKEILEHFFYVEDWQNARKVLLKELKRSSQDHFLLSRLSTTYYEEYKYQKALEIAEKAFKIAPYCPLVLWDYAGTLSMLDRCDEAIAIWKRLLKRGVERIAYGACSEGIRDAKSLLNDCRYRIGLCYHELGKKSLAIRYIQEHLAHRQPGIPSIYSIREVKKALRMYLAGSKINER